MKLWLLHCVKKDKTIFIQFYKKNTVDQRMSETDVEHFKKKLYTLLKAFTAKKKQNATFATHTSVFVKILAIV